MRNALSESSTQSAHQRMQALAELLAEGYLRSRRGYALGDPTGPVSRPVAPGATDGTKSRQGGVIAPGGGPLPNGAAAAN